MKTKILNALKTRFASLGFGEKAFEGVADYLATTITEEEQIETGIAGVEGLLKSFQGDIDKRVTEAVNKAKKEKSTDKPGDQSKKDEQPKQEDVKPKDNEVPEWRKEIEALTSEIQRIKAGKAAENRRSTLEKKIENASPKMKEIIIKDFSRMKFDTDEEFESFLTEKERDLSEINQEISINGLKPFGPPKFGNKESKKEASKDEAKGIVGDLMKN